MTQSLPKIAYKKAAIYDIEVMSFDEMAAKLSQMHSHDPFAPHKIQFYLMIIVTNQAYTHYVDFKYYTLQKGSMLFVAKNQVQHFTKDIKSAKGFCIVINSHFLEQNYFLSKSIRLNRLYNYHLEDPLILPNEVVEDEFITSVEKLYAEYQLPNPFAKEELLRAYIDIILLKAERVKQQHAIRGVKTHWLKVFNQFKSLLEENYLNTRNSRFYASEILVSYKFLNDVVKQATGKTVKAFIDDFVTMEIKRYLASTALSVKEISYKTGFEEPANMTKFFKKNTQQTPLQFRKQL